MTVVGEDGLARPVWASSDPLMREYYDTEWGMPVRDERGLFERISWSTHKVYRETLERARQLDLSVHTLAEWYDVDTIGELRRLRHDLSALPPSVAPATRLALDRLTV